MYRAFSIVMVPVILVALGYVFVLRSLGIPPGYFRLFVAVTVFFGAILWLARKSHKADAPKTNAPRTNAEDR
jgi:ABC-type spermidine/putrescine transport system permease subunit II